MCYLCFTKVDTLLLSPHLYWWQNTMSSCGSLQWQKLHLLRYSSYLRRYAAFCTNSFYEVSWRIWLASTLQRFHLCTNSLILSKSGVHPIGPCCTLVLFFSMAMLWGRLDKKMAWLGWLHAWYLSQVKDPAKRWFGWLDHQRRLHSNAIPTSVKCVPSLFQWHNPMLTKRLFCKERFLQTPVTTLGKSFLRNPTYMCREYYVSVWLVLATNFLLLAKSSACRVYFLYVCLVAVADSLVLAKPLWTSSTCRAYFLCVCLGIVLLWLRITSELTSARSTSRFTVALMANRQPSLQCKFLIF